MRAATQAPAAAPRTCPGPAAPAARHSRPGLRRLAELAVLALASYAPLLASKPGLVAADTKQYLYLDPGRLMAQALSMWDPSIAGGTVTHQKIGYLLPQGPFYYLLAQAHAPVWIAQRLWMGSLLFAAATGVRYLLRVLGCDGPGPLVGGLAYGLSPYLLQYIERISAILLPWSGLGWMVAFSVLAVRRGGWRDPARFALVVALVGGTNATSLLYVGLAPFLFVLFALASRQEAPPRRVLGAALRMAVLSAAVSLWWVSGLYVEGAYGVDVLRYTEQVPAVASASVASEVLRGLGYWYFYGSGRLGPWLRAAVDFETRPALIATSFAVPVLATAAAGLVRWRYRLYFAGLVLVGLALSVGTHPFTDPSLLGRGLKAFMTGTTAGFALRSTDRATPLVVLGLAVLLGAGGTALSARVPRTGALVAAGLVALVVVNNVPLLAGEAIASDFVRPEQIPSYYRVAARYLDEHGEDTRALVLPGEDFAAYDWGNLIDPIWPGIMTRPEIQREQLIQGSYPTADLLDAFDLTLQEGTYDPATLAPIARLLDAGDVVLQSNLAWWRYDIPRPQILWQEMTPPPPGVGPPVGFGKPAPVVPPPGLGNLNEAALALPPDAPWPPPVAVFPVSGARPIYRAEPTTAPLVLDGGGSGIVDAAEAGLLADNPTILYANSLETSRTAAVKTIPPGAALVVTDSNRKELRTWTTVRDNICAVLPAYPIPLPYDPSEEALPLFPTNPPGSQTVAVFEGARYVTASGYGNPVTCTPEDQPAMAFDGNLDTAWTVAAFSLARGNWIQIGLDHPVTADRVDLVQPLHGDPDRWLTEVTLTFDGSHPLLVHLGRASRTAAGQVVRFPRRTFTTLRITLDRTNRTGKPVNGVSGVGFAEIRIPGVTVRRVLQMPSDLLRELGRASLSHRLTLLFDRNWVSPIPPRSDPELTIARRFYLPTARTFAVGGLAKISPLIPDNVIDDLLGGPGVFGGAVIGSNGRLPGDLDARAVFALDGNPKTFWSPGFGYSHQVGAWMEIALPHPISFDHLNLQIVADGRHSVPTAIRITSNEGSNVLVHLPPITDRKAVDATVRVPVQFPRVTGSVVRFTIAAIRPVRTTDYYSLSPITMPVAIAELGIPGVRYTPENPAAPLPDICRSDLIAIDHVPVPVRVVGTVGTAEHLGFLRLVPCGSAAQGIRLAAGWHELTTTWGKLSGYDVDQVVLDSAPGGAALPLTASGAARPVPGTLPGPGTPALAAPRVTIRDASPTSATLDVRDVHGPFWLVLGESLDRGWQATVVHGPSLGSPTLVDGFANGWYVDPSPGTRTLVVHLEFAPQHLVDDALLASAAALGAVLLLALAPSRRRRRSSRQSPPDADGATFASPLGGRSRDGLSLGGPSLLGPAGTRPAWWLVLGAAAAMGALGAALVPPPAGPATGVALGVATGLALAWGPARLVLAVGAVAGAATAGALTLALQLRDRFPAGSAWPTHFDAAGLFAWWAVLALVADALAVALRGRSRAPS